MRSPRLICCLTDCLLTWNTTATYHNEIELIGIDITVTKSRVLPIEDMHTILFDKNMIIKSGHHTT